MKEIVIADFHKTHGEYGTEPYTIAFVYHPEGSCVVKGMSREVRNYIKNNFSRCIYYVTNWQNGKSRGYWSSTLALYIVRKIKGRTRFVVSMRYKNGIYRKSVISFRRVPKKWLDIYNQAGTR